MKIRIGRIFAVLFGLAMSWTALHQSTRADDIEFVTTTAFAAMGERLSDVEGRLAAIEQRGGADDYGSACDGDSWCDACHGSGLTSTAELVVLRLHDNNSLNPSGTLFDSYQAAPRLTVGWQNAGGIGIRARWFDFDTSSQFDIAAPFPSVYYASWNLVATDVEATVAFQLGSRWSGIVSGGVRYAECTHRADEVLLDGSSNSANAGFDDSFGPVVGLEMKRFVTQRLSLFAATRASMQFGDTKNNFVARDATGAVLFENILTRENQTFSISEIQLGAQWDRPIGGDALLFLRGAFEGQYWVSSAGGGSADLGLVGGQFAIGIAR
jgi:hypothetical protein